MEQDQKLKKLLLQGSEKASVHFTEGVMKRVQQLSATPFYYQPLVNPRLKKAFLIAISVLVASIFLLCLLIASPGLSFPDWTVIQDVMIFIDAHFSTILSYIIGFWVVFIANAFVGKKIVRQSAA